MPIKQALKVSDCLNRVTTFPKFAIRCHRCIGCRITFSNNTSIERREVLNKIEIYPYSERQNPRPRGYITPNGKQWHGLHPRGIDYWVRLADIINREPETNATGS